MSGYELLRSESPEFQTRRTKTTEIESYALRGRSRGINKDVSGRTQSGWNGARPIISVSVDKNDTLATVALRHAMQVSDLRRLNNFMSDQDLHARAFIKVYGSNFASQQEQLISIEDQETPGPSNVHTAQKENVDSISNSTNSSSDGSGLGDGQKKFDKLIRGVDKSIANARVVTSSSQVTASKDPLLQELLQAGSDGFSHSDRKTADGRSFVSAGRPHNALLSSFLERSVYHFGCMLLCVFTCVVAPVLVIVFTLEGGSDAHPPAPHHHVDVLGVQKVHS